MIPISLEGKIALVTGASQGIGWAVAQKLAEAGATCVLVARNEELLKEKAALLSSGYRQRHLFFSADMSDNDQVDQLIGFVKQQLPVHILVNNSGGPKPGLIQQASPADFTAALQQHIGTAQRLLQALLPAMKEEQYGRVLNIISTSVRIPIANLGVSNTTRAAMASWAKTWSNEVASFGITVNNLLPGLTQTQRLTSLITSEAQRLQTTEKQVTENMLQTIPAKRFGDPEELANLACFLASPLAAYINGVSIAVDGGRTGTI